MTDMAPASVPSEQPADLPVTAATRTLGAPVTWCLNVFSVEWTGYKCAETVGHDGMHRSEDGTAGWGDPPERVKAWCWRCLRPRWFRRFDEADPAHTGRWRWSYTDGKHERSRPW